MVQNILSLTELKFCWPHWHTSWLSAASTVLVDAVVLEWRCRTSLFVVCREGNNPVGVGEYSSVWLQRYAQVRWTQTVHVADRRWRHSHRGVAQSYRYVPIFTQSSRSWPWVLVSRHFDDRKTVFFVLVLLLVFSVDHEILISNISWFLFDVHVLFVFDAHRDTAWASEYIRHSTSAHNASGGTCLHANVPKRKRFYSQGIKQAGWEWLSDRVIDWIHNFLHGLVLQ